MSTVSTESHKFGNVGKMIEKMNSRPEVLLRSGLPSTAAKKRKCTARFSYSAQQPDELSFVEGEVIEVLEDVEEGWMKGMKQKSGVSGLFPTNFVEFIADDTESTGPNSKGGSGEVAKGVDSSNKIDNSSNMRPSSYIGNRATFIVASAGEGTSTAAADRSKSPSHPQSRERALVMYNYDASAPDELSLKEGTYVDIMSKNSSDDGWYEGEYEGKRGVFPANFVKLVLPSDKAKKDEGAPVSAIALSAATAAATASSAATASPPTPPPTKPVKPLVNNFASSKSTFPPPTESSATPMTSATSASASSSSTAAATAATTVGQPAKSSKVKDLQSTLFGNMDVPKPGGNPLAGRPKTTILDNVHIGQMPKEINTEPAMGHSDQQLITRHPTRDRPRQVKRPPSMMPLMPQVSSDVESPSGSSSIVGHPLTTSFPTKESPPVVAQKPALLPKKDPPPVVAEIASAKEKEFGSLPSKSFKLTSTETILSPANKRVPIVSSSSVGSVPSPQASAAAAASAAASIAYSTNHTESGFVSRKEFNELLAKVNELTKQVAELQKKIPK